MAHVINNILILETSSLFPSLTHSGSAVAPQALHVKGRRFLPGQTGGCSRVPQALHAGHGHHTVQLLREHSTAHRGEVQHITEHQTVEASIHVHHPETNTQTGRERD